MSGGYSFDTGEKRVLDLVDYILFMLLFITSTVIGCYHAYRDRKNTDIETFHLGGRKMHTVPVSMSLVATTVSALTILGTPAEVYSFGTMFYWITLAMLIATATTTYVFLPVFYHMKTISCFGYLQLRFGTPTRLVATILFLLQTLLQMGFVLYVPSLALQAVTGLSLWVSMIGVAAVSTLYTMLGGIKTVLWTDSLQFCVMIIGLLAILIKGCSAVGGVAIAWKIASDRGRIDFTNVSPDPRTRHSVWSVGIGGSIFWSYIYGINQLHVQRECSLPSLKKAQIAVWLNLPGVLLINTLACLIGVVMYAFYSECDPVTYGLVDKNDQLVPLLMLDVLGSVPGISGIFMAAVFSGGLSTMSSGLNAVSAIVLEDHVKHFCFKSLSSNKEVVLSKLVVIITGVGAFGLAVLISRASGMIIQLSYTVYSLISGPILGCFVAGMMFPWTNKFGAVSGLVTSFAVMCWLGLGSKLDGAPGTKLLPVYTNGCYTINSSTIMATYQPPMDNLSVTQPYFVSTVGSTVSPTIDTDTTEGPMVYDFYRMSYQWYTGFGMLLNLVVSLVVSFITGHTDPKSIQPNLISPFFSEICSCLPTRLRNNLRLGIDHSRTRINEYTEEDAVVIHDSCI